MPPSVKFTGTVESSTCSDVGIARFRAVPPEGGAVASGSVAAFFENMASSVASGPPGT